MAERGGRSYRDLTGRTTRKSRSEEQGRLPGDKPSPKKLQDAFDVSDDVGVIVEVAGPEMASGLEEGESFPPGDSSFETTTEDDEMGCAQQHQHQHGAPLEEGYKSMKRVTVPETEVKEYYSTAALVKDYPSLLVTSSDDKDEDDEDEKDDKRDKEGCDGKGPGYAQGCGESKMASSKNIPEVRLADVEILDAPRKTAGKLTFAEKLRQAMEGEGDGTMPPIPDMPQIEGVEMQDFTLPNTEPPSMGECACPGTAPAEIPMSTDEAEGAFSSSGKDTADDDDGVLVVDEPGTAKASPEEAAEENEEEMEDDVKEASAPNTDAVYETLGTLESLANVGVERVALVLANDHTDSPHYIVLVDGDPVAKVALADQPANLSRDHSDLFLAEDYPQFVLEGVGQFGLGETLKNVHARLYAAAAFSGEVAEQMRTAAISEMEAGYRTRMADAKDGLINAANIVLQGSLNNYILENPLKDALVRNMHAAGVEEAAAINAVEHAWREAAPAFFSATLSKAEEWLGAPPEVLEHHIKEISAMSYRHPGYGPSADAIEVAPPVPHNAIPQNVPIRTTASTFYQPAPQQTQQQQQGWDRDYWKNRINLHGRVASASMANHNPGGNKR